MNAWGYAAVVALMVIGLLGIVVPVLPGSSLVALGILIWAIFTGGSAWWVFAAALAVMVLAWGVKYLVGGRTMAKAGVGKWSLVVGGVAGIIGFFVIPVVGLVIGFIGGTFAAEAIRLGTPRPAGRPRSPPPRPRACSSSSNWPARSARSSSGSRRS